MDAFLLQVLNGLDKGGAYALIALGLTLVFGTLGVVNFAHGALFMLGAFCAVTLQKVLTLEKVTLDPEKLTAWGTPMEIRTTYIEEMFGNFGSVMIDYSVPLSILVAIPVMLLLGVAMERGLIRYFYKRVHADQILVTFGLAIVAQEIIKSQFGANPIPQPAPDAFAGSADIGVLLGYAENAVVYPVWRIMYLLFAGVVIGGVFAVYYLRYGGPRRHGRPRTRGPARYRYRSSLYHRIRACRRGRRPRRRHVHTDPVARLSHGHGLSRAQFRGGRSGWHG